jgi:hypothetical protein
MVLRLFIDGYTSIGRVLALGEALYMKGGFGPVMACPVVDVQFITLGQSGSPVIAPPIVHVRFHVYGTMSGCPVVASPVQSA